MCLKVPACLQDINVRGMEFCILKGRDYHVGNTS